jgi:hypothetical protein
MMGESAKMGAKALRAGEEGPAYQRLVRIMGCEKGGGDVSSEMVSGLGLARKNEGNGMRRWEKRS